MFCGSKTLRCLLQAFPVNQTVLDLINELFGKVPQRLERYEVEKLQKYLKSLKVQYEIPASPSSRRTYRVNGLRRSAKEESFVNEDGARMTVQMYFATVKAYPLRYPDLPLIWVGKM